MAVSGRPENLMVKLASSPYEIWLYSYIKHSNSEARRIKRVRGQRLRLDLADRHLPMGFGQLPHRVRCDRGAAAAAGPPHRLCARHGRGQAEEPGEECDGGIVQPVDNYDDASDQHGAANPAKLTYR